MGVLVDETTRVLVQGITGREGSFHARGCMAYGTNVVAGVTPGKGGTMFDDTVPVFNSVEEAVATTQANMSLIFVPPPFAPWGSVSARVSGSPVHTAPSSPRSRKEVCQQQQGPSPDTAASSERSAPRPFSTPAACS